MTSLGRRLADAIPWNAIRRVFWGLRKAVFTTDRRDGPGLLVDTDPERVRIALGKRHFTNGWEFSYSYRGEILNMRRPHYDHTRCAVEGGRHEHVPPHTWYQCHVRGYPHEESGGLELTAHYELEPTAYPRAHLDGTHASVAHGMRMLAAVLQSAGIEYEDLRSEERDAT